MAFDINKYLAENKIELGSIKKEVGKSISKSGHNDLRKTTYDVKIKDGKFDLYTHTSVMTEDKLNESEAAKRNLYNKMEIVIKTLENLEYIASMEQYSADAKKLVKQMEQFIKKAKL